VTVTDNGRSPESYVSRDPVKRQRQLDNIKRKDVARRHGAYSAVALKAARVRVLDEMTVAFPSVRRDRLDLAASLRARIEVITAYVEQNGIFKNVQRGEPYPVVGLLERLEAAYRGELSKIEDLARAAPSDSLAGMVGEAERERAALERGGTP
jgi:hypothetical protein